jgi:hypothetical protein
LRTVRFSSHPTRIYCFRKRTQTQTRFRGRTPGKTCSCARPDHFSTNNAIAGISGRGRAAPPPTDLAEPILYYRRWTRPSTFSDSRPPLVQGHPICCSFSQRRPEPASNDPSSCVLACRLAVIPSLPSGAWLPSGSGRCPGDTSRVARGGRPPRGAIHRAGDPGLLSRRNTAHGPGDRPRASRAVRLVGCHVVRARRLPAG